MTADAGPASAPLDASWASLPSSAVSDCLDGTRPPEMALYVLVWRGGTWWLAAGQNTPVLPPPPR